MKEVNALDPKLNFRIYPAQSLGIKPVAQLDALQNGTLEMAVFPMSYAVGKAQEFSVTILPGTIPTLDHAMKLKRHGISQQAAGSRHPKRIHIVTWWSTTWRIRFEVTRNRRSENRRRNEDARGRPDLRINAAGCGRFGRQHAVDRDLPSCNRAVVDGTLTSAEPSSACVCYEQTKFTTTPGQYALWMLLQPLVMSKQHWDKLTPAQQKIFQQAADKSDDYFLGLQRDAVKDMEEAYKKAGAKVAPDDPGGV